jgi:hypothetical protein
MECGNVKRRRLNVVTTKIWRFRTLGFILLVCFVAGCERATQVRLEGGVKPVFVLSGSGAVAVFTLYSPDYTTKAKTPEDEDFALWKIRTNGGYFSGKWIGDLGSITYGVVPPGYVQIEPKEGTPPSLVEGQKYPYFVETTSAPGAGGYLEIRDSRAVPTTGSGPCFQLINGKETLVPCPKGFD